VADELSSRESALRKLPLPYSLALRLRDAGVAPEVVSEYVGVDEAALDGVYRIAEVKLSAAEAGTPANNLVKELLVINSPACRSRRLW
jgi:hypothetical protein